MHGRQELPMWHSKIISLGFLLGLLGQIQCLSNAVSVVKSSEAPQWLVDYNLQISADKPGKQINAALLSLISKTNQSVNLLVQNDQCFGCELEHFLSVRQENGSESAQIQSSHSNHIEIQSETNNTSNQTLCRGEITFEEEGDYWLVVDPESDFPCILYLLNSPPNIYLPIVLIFIVLFFVVCISLVLKFVSRQSCYTKLTTWLQTKKSKHEFSSTNELELKDANDTTENNNQKQLENRFQQKPAQRRLKSLDTFRGLSLVIMIFANYGGGGYWFFGHAEWNGLTVADLVFPWFVFIMGTSMAFSFRSLKKKEIPRTDILLKVVKRTFILFLIGLSLNSSWYVKLEELRIPGVLQRLALCYFLVAVPHVFFAKLQPTKEGKGYWFRDVTDYWAEWLLHLSTLAAYLCLTFLLPVPGCPRGYLGPGGLHNGGKYFNCTGGAAGYIDKVVLGNNHIYQWATFKELYNATENFDPEGILGTLCAAFMCFLGLQVGKIVLYHKSHKERVIRWFLWAIFTGGIAVLLCKGTQNDGWIPLNKNLWSLSFTLALSSMAFVLLGILYLVIDLYNVWSGAPFRYPGLNSLLVYVGHSVFGTFFPIRWKVSTDDHWHNTAMAVWATGIWCIIAFILCRKNIFVAL